MIVILYPNSGQMFALAAQTDLLKAFTSHVEVECIDEASAASWPSTSLAWDDLLIVIFDAAPLSTAGTEFINKYLAERGENAMILPVALDASVQKPPKPAGGVKALLYDATAAGENGRLVKRTGGMLGLRVQGRNTKIFISYRAADGKEIAEQVNAHLRSLGHSTFLDEAKELDGEPAILPGNPVQKEIEEALESANLVLLIDTPKSLESTWIKREIDSADGLLIPVLPIAFRANSDAKKATRFRQLLALQRWVSIPLPAAGPNPLIPDQLEQIVREAESYLCDIFQRKCRIPFLVEKEFVSRGFAWSVLDQKLLMFSSSKVGGRLTTKVLKHCSIFDDVYEPALRRFNEFIESTERANHSLFIYEGEIRPDTELLDLARHAGNSIVILHHQELAVLLDSNFTTLGAA